MISLNNYRTVISSQHSKILLKLWILYSQFQSKISMHYLKGLKLKINSQIDPNKTHLPLQACTLIIPAAFTYIHTYLYLLRFLLFNHNLCIVFICNHWHLAYLFRRWVARPFNFIEVLEKFNELDLLLQLPTNQRIAAGNLFGNWGWQASCEKVQKVEYGFSWGSHMILLQLKV